MITKSSPINTELVMYDIILYNMSGSLDLVTLDDSEPL